MSSDGRETNKPDRKQKDRNMKTTKMTGADIKADNGSGYNLAGAYPTRRFHDKTIYTVKYNGVSLDRSTVVSIERSRNGWGN